MTDKLQQVLDAIESLESSVSGLDTTVSDLDGTLDLVLDHMHQRFDALEKLVVDGFKALGVQYVEPPEASSQEMPK